MNKKNEKWLWLIAIMGSFSRLVHLVLSLIFLLSDKKARQKLMEERKPLLMFLFILLLPFTVLYIASFFLPLDLSDFWEILSEMLTGRKHQFN